MAGNFKMMAKTLYGFEPILAKELRNLGAGHVEEGVRNVTFEGDTGFMYKANLCLRTALKVFKPIKTFRVFNENDLYRHIFDLNCPIFLMWRKLLPSIVLPTHRFLIIPCLFP